MKWMGKLGLSQHAQGLLIAFVAVLVLSSDSLLVRKVGNLPNFVVIFYKNLFYAMPLALYLLVTCGVSGFWEKFRVIGPLGWFAGFVWGASNFMITYGFQVTAIASVLVIVASNPMFAAIFSFIILKEPVPWYTVLAGLVCFGSIIVIFYSELTSSSDPNIGGLLAALGSAITTGFFFVVIRLIDMRSENSIGSIDPMPYNVIAGLFTCIVCLILDPNQNITDSMSGLYLFIDGIFVWGISFTLLNWCPSMISPTEVSLMMLVETGMGPLFVFLAGYEAPPKMAIYGGCALAVALLFHSYVAVHYDNHSEKVNDADNAKKVTEYETLSDKGNSRKHLEEDKMGDECTNFKDIGEVEIVVISEASHDCSV
jgi:drug/metabolite transporter (DMT)-like permease